MFLTKEEKFYNFLLKHINGYDLVNFWCDTMHKKVHFRLILMKIQEKHPLCIDTIAYGQEMLETRYITKEQRDIFFHKYADELAEKYNIKQEDE